MDRFADRLDPDGFAEGEPVVFHLVTSREGRVSLPEGVCARLVQLGFAYDLHILGTVLTPYESVTLDPLQAESLAEELDFLLTVVRDPVIESAAGTVAPIVALSARGGVGLVVDWDI